MTILKTFTVLIGLTLGISCSQPSRTTSGDQSASASTIAADLDVASFAQKMETQSDYILLDVRTPEETALAKIQDAMEIDIHQTSFLENVSLLPKNKPVFVYCRSGHRSGQAMAKMHELGFQEVYNLKGGILAWQKSGRPVDKQ